MRQDRLQICQDKRRAFASVGVLKVLLFDKKILRFPEKYTAVLAADLTPEPGKFLLRLSVVFFCSPIYDRLSFSDDQVRLFFF